MYFKCIWNIAYIIYLYLINNKVIFLIYLKLMNNEIYSYGYLLS